MPIDNKLDTIIERDRSFYMNTFGNRAPVCFTHGEGVYLYGTDDKKYADLIGGIAVNVLGHGNKPLVEAISKQAGELIHCSNLYYIENQTLLAEKLVALAPGMGKVFLANSGAEANEGAIKLAKAFFYKQGAPRAKIVTAINSFHGRTIATATATGQEKYSKMYAPLPGGFVHVKYNDIESAKNAIDSDTCAVILELIQGESGIIPADKEYISAVAEACKQCGTLLIIDEIQTGIGRTGTFFAYEQYGITPDIVTLAKGLGGGVPIGAFLASDKVAAAFAPGDHGSTFGGNPLACAAGMAVLDEICGKKLVERAGIMGKLFMEKLNTVAKSTGKISAVRGLGLMIGIEFNEPIAVSVKNMLLESGYMVNSIGDSVIRVLPPLIIEECLMDEFCSELTAVLSCK